MAMWEQALLLPTLFMRSFNMKRLLIALLLIPSLCVAETVRTVSGPHATVQTDGTNASGEVNIITNNAGPINFYLNKVKAAFFSAAGAFNLVPRGDLNRAFVFDASSDTAHTLKWGDNGTTAAQELTISSGTANDDDDTKLFIAGGGAAASNRGAYILLGGNESTSPGAVYVIAGNVTNAAIYFQTGDGSSSRTRWQLSQASGDFTNDATYGGDVVFSKLATGVKNPITTAVTPGALTAGAFATPAAGGVLSVGVNVLPAAMATAANFVALPAATANVGKSVVVGVRGAVSANVAAGTVGDTLNAGAQLTPAACTTGMCTYTAYSTTGWIGR